MKLIRTYHGERPSPARWGGKASRAVAGMTIAAVRSPHLRPCRYCGEPEHRAKVCSAPVLRGWGWKGWQP